MTQIVRPATPDDIPRMVELLLLDAEERHSVDGILWKLAEDAAAQIEKALTFALTAAKQPFRQIWQVAAQRGHVAGVIHSMMLPVPPIYAGRHGEPGLILPDSFAAPDAPDGTVDALVDAAEAALAQAGAQITLSSFVAGEDWQEAFARRGYDPLTLYLSRTSLEERGMPAGVRQATGQDIAGIVTRSAENRRVLFDIDRFWEPHPEADARFSAWMTRSLTLPDRDMMVAGAPGDIAGYVVAQPASRLHFPPAHDITGTGVIDDYFHVGLADPAMHSAGRDGAMSLLRAAETALARRGAGSALVVCPAGWRSKIGLLEDAGYKTAMCWSIKR